MSINSRNSIGFEREVCSWIQDEFGVSSEKPRGIRSSILATFCCHRSPSNVALRRVTGTSQTGGSRFVVWHAMTASRYSSIGSTDSPPGCFPYVLGDYPTNNDMARTVGLEEGAMIIREVLNETRRFQAPSESAKKLYWDQVLAAIHDRLSRWKHDLAVETVIYYLPGDL